MQDLQEKIEEVQTYLAFLKSLETKLRDDETQLAISADEAEEAIRENFRKIKKIVIEELENREKTLIDIIKDFYLSESTSIKNRIIDISKNVDTLEHLVTLKDHENKFRKIFEDGIETIKNDCLNLSIQRSVRIATQFDDKARLIACCRSFGMLSCGSPVKILKPKPRPGALLIQWETVEKNFDVEEYRLQKMHIRTPFVDKRHKFEDCYIGPETEFLVKNLIPNNQYLFRVCLRYESHPKWSEWSTPRLASTSFRPLCWKNNSNFLLSCNNTIAESLAEKPVILYSVKFSFYIGYCVEIMFLKCDENPNDAFIGLSATEEYPGKVLDLPKAIFLEANGHIYSDGQRKTTKLPPIRQNKKVVFTCEKYEDNKLRLHIDNHNMRVTYDWNVESPEIYVCTSFSSPYWKIAIN